MNLLKDRMDQNTNTTLALEFGLDPKAVDFVERMVRAGHEFNVQRSGPQPIVTLSPLERPLSIAEILEWEQLARDEDKVRRVVTTFVEYYSD